MSNFRCNLFLRVKNGIFQCEEDDLLTRSINLPFAPYPGLKIDSIVVCRELEVSEVYFWYYPNKDGYFDVKFNDEINEIDIEEILLSDGHLAEWYSYDSGLHVSQIPRKSNEISSSAK